jgi:hypothetical protein
MKYRNEIKEHLTKQGWKKVRCSFRNRGDKHYVTFKNPEGVDVHPYEIMNIIRNPCPKAYMTSGTYGAAYPDKKYGFDFTMRLDGDINT